MRPLAVAPFADGSFAAPDGIAVDASDGIAVHGGIVPGREIGPSQDPPGERPPEGVFRSHAFFGERVCEGENPFQSVPDREPVGGPRLESGHGPNPL